MVGQNPVPTWTGVPILFLLCMHLR
uniref:Uncharacterized protein n=1 Tax=Rhizophora mucronata TaxID=61149 RepID=A0A2P2QIS6_RHIMU